MLNFLMWLSCLHVKFRALIFGSVMYLSGATYRKEIVYLVYIDVKVMNFIIILHFAFYIFQYMT